MNISSKEFNEKVINGKEECLVDFHAEWCGPCHMMEPVMNEIGKEHKVYMIDTDENDELAMKYGIMSIPCIIYFKDGKEVNRSIGLRSKDEILDMIKNVDK